MSQVRSMSQLGKSLVSHRFCSSRLEEMVKSIEERRFDLARFEFDQEDFLFSFPHGDHCDKEGHHQLTSQ